MTIEYQGKPLTNTVQHEKAGQAEMVPRGQLDLKMDGLAAAPAALSKQSVSNLTADHPGRRFRIKPHHSKTHALRTFPVAVTQRKLPLDS